MSPYFYRQGATNLGIGVDALAFQSHFGQPINGPYLQGSMVQRTLSAQSPGFVKVQQDFVPVALIANGVAFAGAFELQRLADMQRK